MHFKSTKSFFQSSLFPTPFKLELSPIRAWNYQKVQFSCPKTNPIWLFKKKKKTSCSIFSLTKSQPLSTKERTIPTFPHPLSPTLNKIDVNCQNFCAEQNFIISSALLATIIAWAANQKRSSVKSCFFGRWRWPHLKIEGSPRRGALLLSLSLTLLLSTFPFFFLCCEDKFHTEIRTLQKKKKNSERAKLLSPAGAVSDCGLFGVFFIWCCSPSFVCEWAWESEIAHDGRKDKFNFFHKVCW